MNSRITSEDFAVVVFEADKLISTVKTSTILNIDSTVFPNDKVKLLWGNGKQKEEYSVIVLFTGSWSECRTFELEEAQGKQPAKKKKQKDSAKKVKASTPSAIKNVAKKKDKPLASTIGSFESAGTELPESLNLPTPPEDLVHEEIDNHDETPDENETPEDIDFYGGTTNQKETNNDFETRDEISIQKETNNDAEVYVTLQKSSPSDTHYNFTNSSLVNTSPTENTNTYFTDLLKPCPNDTQQRIKNSTTVNKPPTENTNTSFANALRSSLETQLPEDDWSTQFNDLVGYVEDMLKRISGRMDRIENIRGESIPSVNFTSLNELWDYVIKLEAHFEDRLRPLECSNPMDLSVGSNLVASLPGGSPSVKRHVVSTPLRSKKIKLTEINISSINNSQEKPGEETEHEIPEVEKEPLRPEEEQEPRHDDEDRREEQLTNVSVANKSKDLPIHARLRQDKESVLEDKLAKPNFDLTQDQVNICQAIRLKAPSITNFASICIMKLFPYKELANKNMNGMAGKNKIPQYYQDTVLLALYNYYGHEFYNKLVSNWKKCVTAIDKKLRNYAYSKSSSKSSAK